MKRLFSTLLMGILFVPVTAWAQDGVNQVGYAALAQQFSTTNLNGDASASVLPSVAMQNGFGTYIDNPAAAAFIKQSFFNVGYFGNQGESESTYLGEVNSLDGNRGRFSNFGLVYSVPTSQGSLVMGGGYTLTNTYNHLNYLSGFNTQSTITDAFVDYYNQYNVIAYNAFAIEETGELDNSGQPIYDSSLRFFDDNGAYTYLGIDQTSEIKNSSNNGELSLFAATEFQQNWFIGASFSLITGRQSYSRDFLESDKDNLYNYSYFFADDNGENGTDIDKIVLRDEINSDILGTSFRVGTVYRLLDLVNIGVSYLVPSTIYISEEYYSSIQTTFDDASQTDVQGLEGNFSYEIKKPGQLNVGIALTDLNGLSVSTSLEYIDYRNTELDLTTDPNLSFDDVSYYKEEQNVINSEIDANYQAVTNLKAGVKYAFAQGYEVSAGFNYLPGKSTVYTTDKTIFAAGIGVPLSKDIFLDVSSQYTTWKDRSLIYTFFDSEAGQWSNTTVQEDISQLNILVGLKFNF